MNSSQMRFKGILYVKGEDRIETLAENLAEISYDSEINQIYEGMTMSGRKVTFEIVTGITDQGLYGAGTLECEGKTIFTKGYPSRAMAWMAQN
ncbi:MAG: hypothetical protein H6Q70_2073 [Firmicutes bacterium]|nr:hypothetical protein [Bacillota bacterium]